MSESSTNVSAATAVAAPRVSTSWQLLTPALALVGAAIVAVAVWLPWSTGTPVVAAGSALQAQTLQISAGDVDGVLSLGPWSAVMVAGVLLSCLFSLRGPRWLGLLARGCYLLWTLVALGVITPTAVALLTTNPVRIRPVEGFLQLTVAHAVHPAMLLTYLGFLVALLASVLGFLELWGTQTSDAASGWLAGARKLPASGALTLSAVLFLIGIFAMPWATVNCTQTPLFLGQCTGVNYAGAASVGIRADVNLFDPLAARYAIPILLAGGALLMLLGVWRRGLFSAGGLWLVLWLLTATLFAVLGNAGVGALIANPPAYGLSAGRWSGDTGVVVAFLGLLIGWGATLYVGILSLLRGRGAGSAEAE